MSRKCFHMAAPEPVDVGKGRCRLPTPPFRWDNTKMGAPVIVETEDRAMFLCTAWPQLAGSSNLLGGAFDTINVDTTVKIRDANKKNTNSSNNSSSSNNNNAKTNPAAASITTTTAANILSIKILHQLPAKALHVLLQPTTYANLNNNNNDAITTQKAKAFLSGLVLVKGCTVAIPGLASFEVKETQPAGQLVIVKRRTVVHILNYSTLEDGDVGNEEESENSIQRQHGAVSKTGWSGLGGVTDIEAEFDSIINLGLGSGGGILIHGPPGVGKTHLVRNAATRYKTNFMHLQLGATPMDELPDLLSDAFEQITASATEEAKTAGKTSRRQRQQSISTIVLFDDIDVLQSVEGDRIGVSVVSQLCTLIDKLVAATTVGSKVLLIAATNRPSSVHQSFRRHGRFYREIVFPPPSEDGRKEIFEMQARKMPIDEAIDFGKLARETVGYVGADIVSLCREAALQSIRSNRDKILMEDFAHGIRLVRPSLQRSEYNEINKAAITQTVSWSSIGGLEEVKLKLRQSGEWPVIHRDAFTRLGLTAPRGILLYGPPGCAKTTLVKALASSTHSTFLYLNGASIYSPYLGDAERTIRDIFTKARTASPSIIFFDEIDAIVGKRDFGDNDKSSGVEKRVLSTLLNEMDGIENTQNVLVVAATNRPDMLDAALMRPGRIDNILYVPPPDEEARLEILKVHTRKMPLDDSVNLVALAGPLMTHNFTGAELEGLCREAALTALREDINASKVTMNHFIMAKRGIHPTLTPDLLKLYSDFEKAFYAKR